MRAHQITAAYHDDCAGVGVERPRDGHALPLPARQVDAPLPDLGLVPGGRARSGEDVQGGRREREGEEERK